LLWLALLPLLWWALRNIPAWQVWQTLARLSLGQVLALVLLNAAIFLLFTGRWWIILRGQGYRLPFLSLTGYRLAAFAITYFTPGPQMGGEPLQVHLIRRHHSVPAATAVAAVTLDKLLEMQANFAFLVLGMVVVLQNGLFGARLGALPLILVALLLALPALFVIALWLGARPIARLVEWILAHHSLRPGLERAIEGMISAEAQVAEFCRRKPLALIQALALSLLAWVFMLGEYWLVLRFLGARLDLFQTISMLTAARVAFLLPIPAGIGTLEAGQALVAQALGLPPALGIGASLLIRARDLAFAGAGLWLGAAITSQRPAPGLPSEVGD
jgi:uncharacterized protein (TIRG00374 family)